MLDVRVKERLTGAIILVAVLVLLVPELLTGRGHSASSGQAPANSEAGQTRSYTIDLADSSASKPVTAAATTPAGAAPAATPDSQTNAAPSPEDAGSAAVPPESDAATSDAPSSSAEPERPVPAPRPGDKPRVAQAEVAPAAGRDDAPKPATSTRRVASADSVKAPAATPKSSVRTASEPESRAGSPEAKAGSGWAVQVGSFASRENAERLTRELKGKGFAATVSESTGKGKRLWRVRVGPEADRAAAVAVGAKLRSAGHSGGAVVPYP